MINSVVLFSAVMKKWNEYINKSHIGKCVQSYTMFCFFCKSYIQQVVEKKKLEQNKEDIARKK